MDRAKDVDTLTRRLVYTRVLAVKLSHPKQLTIAQREQVVKEGLGDREPAVRLAAGKLITRWLDIFQAEQEDKLPWTGDDAGVMHGLVRLLRAFDPVGPGVDVAADALSAVFSTRPSVIDAIVFEGSSLRFSVLVLLCLYIFRFQMITGNNSQQNQRS